MYTFFIIIEVLVSILLMLAVLMQSSKGTGLAGTFGSANIGSVFGVRRTSDFLTLSTQWLAAAFLLLALAINLWFLPHGLETRQSVIQSVPPPSTIPQAQPGPEQTAPEQIPPVASPAQKK